MSVLFYNKFTLLKMGDDPPWGIILIILTYFLLFFWTSTFGIKGSSMSWNHFSKMREMCGNEVLYVIARIKCFEKF